MANSEVVAGAKILGASDGIRAIQWSSSAPSYGTNGMLWVDTSSAVPALKVYNGSAWVLLFNSVFEVVYAAPDAVITVTPDGTSWSTQYYTIPYTFATDKSYVVDYTFKWTDGPTNNDGSNPIPSGITQPVNAPTINTTFNPGGSRQSSLPYEVLVVRQRVSRVSGDNVRMVFTTYRVVTPYPENTTLYQNIEYITSEAKTGSFQPQVGVSYNNSVAGIASGVRQIEVSNVVITQVTD